MALQRLKDIDWWSRDQRVSPIWNICLQSAAEGYRTAEISADYHPLEVPHRHSSLVFFLIRLRIPFAASSFQSRVNKAAGESSGMERATKCNWFIIHPRRLFVVFPLSPDSQFCKKKKKKGFEVGVFFCSCLFLSWLSQVHDSPLFMHPANGKRNRRLWNAERGICVNKIPVDVVASDWGGRGEGGGGVIWQIVIFNRPFFAGVLPSKHNWSGKKIACDADEMRWPTWMRFQRFCVFCVN